MASVRIKVRVSDLIEKIEQAKAKAKVDYDQALALFQATKASNEKVVRSAKTIGQSPDGIWQDYRRFHHVWVVALDLPADFEMCSKPNNLDLSYFDKDISLLKMVSDETLAISTEDRWNKYL